jgi:predicted HTH transcriptional regulator
VALIDRLRNSEDQLTERKEGKVSYEKVAETIVAFANSLQEDQEGVLFIGVTDKGEIKGVPNPDKMQKWVSHIAHDTLYPPVPIEQHVLDVDWKSVVAVVVRRSYNGPHFAGPAYIRVGSVNRQASENQFDRLIAERLSPLRPIVQAFESQAEVLVDRRASYGGLERHRAKVVEVNAHWVQF